MKCLHMMFESAFFSPEVPHTSHMSHGIYNEVGFSDWPWSQPSPLSLKLAFSLGRPQKDYKYLAAYNAFSEDFDSDLVFLAELQDSNKGTRYAIYLAGVLLSLFIFHSIPGLVNIGILAVLSLYCAELKVKTWVKYIYISYLLIVFVEYAIVFVLESLFEEILVFPESTVACFGQTQF